MPDFNLPQYGAPIMFNNTVSEMGANAMVSQFLNLKKKYKKRLLSMVDPQNGERDPHACRFFCEYDCAYVFNAEKIQALLDAIKATKKDKDGTEVKDGCLILFSGLRKDFDYGNAFGRPTVIACAYEASSDGLMVHKKISYPSKENKKVMTSIDGFEHPGDGITSPPPFKASFSDELTSTMVKLNQNPMGDTDYVICQNIDLMNGFK